MKLQHSRFAAAPRNVRLEIGGDVIDFNIGAVRGTVLRGKVLEPTTNRPLPGARVQGRTASGRVNAYADAAGEFSWVVLPGQASIMFTSPPAGVYVTDGGNRPTNVSVRAVGDPVDIVVYAPSLALPLADVRGKLLKPDGSPAAGVTVHVVPTINFSAAGRSTYIHSTATNADGSFTISGVPTVSSIGVYCETPKRDLAFAKVIKIAVAQTEFERPFELEKTTMCNVPIKDGEGKLLKNMALKLRPIIGSKWPLDYDRAVKTDENGVLKVPGIHPGIPYFVRDAKAELHRSDWPSYFHREMKLIEEN